MLTYDRGNGVAFAEPEMQRDFRSAIEGWLESLLPRPVPHWGTIDFGDPDLASKVDEVLAEGFGQQ